MQKNKSKSKRLFGVDKKTKVTLANTSEERNKQRMETRGVSG